MFRVKMLCLLDSQGVIKKINLVQLKIVSVCSEKPICAPPCFSEVSPMLHLKQFQCLIDDSCLLSFQGRLSFHASVFVCAFIKLTEFSQQLLECHLPGFAR